MSRFAAPLLLAAAPLLQIIQAIFGFSEFGLFLLNDGEEKMTVIRSGRAEISKKK